MNIKNLASLNLEEMEGKINTTLVFTVFYGALDQWVVDRIIDEKKISFKLDRDNPIILG